MQGIYDGPATFNEVSKHGDFGIGTVNHLDGEMIGLDGFFIKSLGMDRFIASSQQTRPLLLRFVSSRESIRPWFRNSGPFPPSRNG